MNKNKTLKIIKEAKGLDRKAHFENGGDVASWRGRKNIYKNKKKYSRKSKHKGA